MAMAMASASSSLGASLPAWRSAASPHARIASLRHGATMPGSLQRCGSSSSKASSFGFACAQEMKRFAKSTAAAAYKVKFVTPAGEEAEVEVQADQYLLDAGEEAGMDLPYSCRAGSCSSCAAKIIQGTVDQAEQAFLDDDQIASGLVLTCVAHPTSDLVLYTHQEESL